MRLKLGLSSFAQGRKQAILDQDSFLKFCLAIHDGGKCVLVLWPLFLQCNGLPKKPQENEKFEVWKGWESKGQLRLLRRRAPIKDFRGLEQYDWLRNEFFIGWGVHFSQDFSDEELQACMKN